MIPMGFKDRFPIIAALFILALVLVGEVIVTVDSRDSFSSSIAVQGDSVEITMDSHGSHIYRAVALDGTFGIPERVCVYFDTDYVSAAATGVSSTGGRPLDERYYVDQMHDTLKVRGIDYSEIVGAKGLADVMGKDGDGVAVIVISGSLPDTVYDGTADSKIFEWMESGGRLYWIGGILGKFISHTDGLETVENGTTLFLGSECIDDEVSRGYDMIENGFRDALYIQSNLTTFSIDVSKLPAGTDYLSMGFTDGKRSSIVTVKEGDGAVCVIGGEYTIRQRIDLAQLVASGISPDTEIVGIADGTVNGTVKETIAKADSVYITMGGFYPVYCQNHEVDRCSSATPV